MVFYACATGMLPFDNPNIPDLLQMVKRGRYSIPEWVDEDMKDLLRQMLNVNVQERIKTPQVATGGVSDTHERT